MSASDSHGLQIGLGKAQQGAQQQAEATAKADAAAAQGCRAAMPLECPTDPALMLLSMEGILQASPKCHCARAARIEVCSIFIAHILSPKNIQAKGLMLPHYLSELGQRWC